MSPLRDDPGKDAFGEERREESRARLSRGSHQKNQEFPSDLSENAPQLLVLRFQNIFQASIENFIFRLAQFNQIAQTNLRQEGESLSEEARATESLYLQEAEDLRKGVMDFLEIKMEEARRGGEDARRSFLEAIEGISDAWNRMLPREAQVETSPHMNISVFLAEMAMKKENQKIAKKQVSQSVAHSSLAVQSALRSKEEPVLPDPFVEDLQRGALIFQDMRTEEPFEKSIESSELKILLETWMEYVQEMMGKYIYNLEPGKALLNLGFIKDVYREHLPLWATESNYEEYFGAAIDYVFLEKKV